MAQIGLRDTLTENTYIMDAKGYGQVISMTHLGKLFVYASAQRDALCLKAATICRSSCAGSAIQPGAFGTRAGQTLAKNFRKAAIRPSRACAGTDNEQLAYRCFVRDDCSSGTLPRSCPCRPRRNWRPPSAPCAKSCRTRDTNIQYWSHWARRARRDATNSRAVSGTPPMTAMHLKRLLARASTARARYHIHLIVL